jgi:hypothetical protein
MSVVVAAVVSCLTLPALAGAAPQAAAAQASCGGERATKVGTPQSDTLKGTKGRDVIAALGGDDRVSGLAADDVVCGGSGADQLAGAAGDDTLLGGPGSDACLGGPGQDSPTSCELGSDPAPGGNLCEVEWFNNTSVHITPVSLAKGDHDSWLPGYAPLLNQPYAPGHWVRYVSQATPWHGCFNQVGFILHPYNQTTQLGSFTITDTNPFAGGSSSLCVYSGPFQCQQVSFDPHNASAVYSIIDAP